MANDREPYVKPMLTRLEYAADVKVSMTTSCKTADSGSGSGGVGACDIVGGSCSESS